MQQRWMCMMLLGDSARCSTLRRHSVFVKDKIFFQVVSHDSDQYIDSGAWNVDTTRIEWAPWRSSQSLSTVIVWQSNRWEIYLKNASVKTYQSVCIQGHPWTIPTPHLTKMCVPVNIQCLVHWIHYLLATSGAHLSSQQWTADSSVIGASHAFESIWYCSSHAPSSF